MKLRLWEYNRSESSGKNIVAITVDDETPRKILNVGGRSTNPDNWLELTRARWDYLFQIDSIEFVAFSQKAAEAIRRQEKGTYTIGRRKIVKMSAENAVYR